MSVVISPKVKSAFLINDKDKCQCGCFRILVHCPECGSTQCYASKRNNPEILLPGFADAQEVRAFRCKLCGNIFSEDQCASACRAVTRFRQRAEQEERASRASKALPPAEAQRIVNELRRMRGLPAVATATSSEEPNPDDPREKL
jgi:hypothetical protein